MGSHAGLGGDDRETEATLECFLSQMIPDVSLEASDCLELPGTVRAAEPGLHTSVLRVVVSLQVFQMLIPDSSTKLASE